MRFASAPLFFLLNLAPATSLINIIIYTLYFDISLTSKVTTKRWGSAAVATLPAFTYTTRSKYSGVRLSLRYLWSILCQSPIHFIQIEKFKTKSKRQPSRLFSYSLRFICKSLPRSLQTPLLLIIPSPSCHSTIPLPIDLKPHQTQHET